MSRLAYIIWWMAIAAIVVGCGALLIHSRSIAATTQLPPGEVCFQTSAGPVSSGSLNMYIPNTTTPKATWKDSGQVSQNTQPIQLDANGCAIIYGVGTYRQQLFDGPVVLGLTTGNLVFDLLTTDTSAFNQTFWAGSATGTPNGIQLTDAGWNSTPGVILNFKAIANNTGPVTVTILPSNFTAPLVVDTNLGPTPLTGGEIVQSNTPRLLFDNVANVFHLTNPSTTSGGGGSTGVPIGAEVSCPGFNPPSNFQFESGQLLSRTAFTTLFAQLTLTQAGTTSGTQIVSGLTDTSQLAIGMALEGTNIPAATTISSVDSTTQIHISNNASGSGTNNITFFAYGNGDGATTFGIPDRRGQLLYGRDNIGGTAAGVLTSTYTTNTPDALGQKMLSPARVAGGGLGIAQGYLPAVGLSVNIPGGQGSHTHALSNGGSVISFITGPNNLSAGGNSNSATTTIANQTLPAMTGTTTAMGSSVPISPISPGQTTNWCIRVQ